MKIGDRYRRCQYLWETDELTTDIVEVVKVGDRWAEYVVVGDETEKRHKTSTRAYWLRELIFSHIGVTYFAPMEFEDAVGDFQTKFMVHLIGRRKELEEQLENVERRISEMSLVFVSPVDESL